MPKAALSPVGKQPSVTVRHSTTTNLVNSTYTLLPWDTEVDDPYGFHDNAVNNSRLTVPPGLAGIYLIAWHIWFASNATNSRFVRVLKNKAGNASGQDEFGDVRIGANGLATVCLCSHPIPLVVGDYIELTGWQNSGGALLINQSPGYIPQLMMTRLSS